MDNIELNEATITSTVAFFQGCQHMKTISIPVSELILNYNSATTKASIENFVDFIGVLHGLVAIFRREVASRLLLANDATKGVGSHINSITEFIASGKHIEYPRSVTFYIESLRPWSALM